MSHPMDPFPINLDAVRRAREIVTEGTGVLHSEDDLVETMAGLLDAYENLAARFAILAAGVE